MADDETIEGEAALSGLVAIAEEWAVDGQLSQSVFKGALDSLDLPARLYRAAVDVLEREGIRIVEDQIDDPGDVPDRDAAPGGSALDGFGFFMRQTAHRVLTFEEEQDLGKILDAGRQLPTMKRQQPWPVGANAAWAYVLVAVAAAIVIGACGFGGSDDRTGSAVEVVDVLDGDTIDVRLPGGEVDRVRIIGINAPETGECVADDATDAVRNRLQGEAVTLTADRSDRDQFGRLLRYVEVEGADVGADLVAEGFAIARRYPPDTGRAGRYERLQDEAERTGAGLWASDACGPGSTISARLRFSLLRFDADGPDVDNLNDEWVRLENTGASIDLSGWVIRDESSSNRYRFPPSFVLDRDARVTLRTGCGADTRVDLYWCRSGSAVWNNDGDTAFLLDPDGNVVTSESD